MKKLFGFVAATLLISSAASAQYVPPKFTLPLPTQTPAQAGANNGSTVIISPGQVGGAIAIIPETSHVPFAPAQAGEYAVDFIYITPSIKYPTGVIKISNGSGQFRLVTKPDGSYDIQRWVPDTWYPGDPLPVFVAGHWEDIDGPWVGFPFYKPGEVDPGVHGMPGNGFATTSGNNG